MPECRSSDFMSRQNGSVAALRREDINIWLNMVGASSPRDLLLKLKPAFRSYNLRAEVCLNAVAATLRREDINIWLNMVGASSPRDLLLKLKPAFRSYNLRAEVCLNAVAATLRREDINIFGQRGRSEFTSRSST
ncbi:hypothetical protein PPIS_a4314 [Pseudoalteromonas piscicida]|uniref:Uncharacterized protein n=1 Tax=Pseudoalteromonas piscicida TaxID=43662 RepID=A0ABN5CJU4_PSEO7|nr:hypothetical protein PPIS_a4314 [Pseudoalteromonas piscicida]